MILTYRYRIKDKRARKALRAYALAVNQVWNYCNSLQKDIEARYRAGAPNRKWPTHFDFTKLTSGSSRELDVDSQSISEVCRFFVISRDRAKQSLKFRHSFGSKRSLGWIPFRAQSRQIYGNAIIYRKRTFRIFGSVKRPIPDTAKGGCFVEDARGRWYVCFHVEVEDRATGNGLVGIDLGLKSLATLSDGQTIDAPQHYRKYEAELAVHQRAGNKRRIKAIHAKIANCRRDFIHKATTKIARENALIVVGDVSNSWLSKTRMAKSAFDASWGMFRSQLRYKASRHGAVYLDVDERFTTVTCSTCGARGGPEGQKGLRIRSWDCSECGASHDRDVNAARNILALALSAQRPVGESQKADKHEMPHAGIPIK